ncbi:MAG: hypothetical protein GEU75_05605 [Dehalococcoidia bacterium]|nr:hypothetical protein [Dehalococcoidia bacterium]
MIAVQAASWHPAGRAARSVLMLMLLAGLGALSVLQPLAALACLAPLYLALRREHIFRDAFAGLLIGNVVFSYGFANVGFRLGGMPVPLTEMILLPLAGWVLLYRRSLTGIGLPGYFLAALLAYALLRLIIDFPRYGTLALRDFTTPLELLCLLVAFWAFNEYGFEWAKRMWLAVCLCVIGYALLFPFYGLLAAHGPIFGLQQPVPLMGQYVEAGVGIGVAFFFCLLRLKAPASLVLGAFCLAAIAMIQMRGLYLAIPVVILVVLIASGRVRTGMPARLAGTLLFGGLVLMLVIPQAPQGRVGQVNVSTVGAQLSTLLGRSGPGDSSFEYRVNWLNKTWTDQTQSLDRMLLGSGLGTDLASGFAVGENDQLLVRKPHNDYIEVFARYGVIGMLPWIGLFGSLGWALWRAARSSYLTADERTFVLWLIAGVSIYMLIAATQPLLAFPCGTLPLITMLGMGLALLRQAEARARTDTDDLEGPAVTAA